MSKWITVRSTTQDEININLDRLDSITYQFVQRTIAYERGSLRVEERFPDMKAFERKRSLIQRKQNDKEND